jgi:two-component system, sensor histidine kinase
VADNGIGIPPEELAEVFNLFMQSADSLARSEGGLGIGLSLARTLTELHGGKIEAHSAGAGKGCEFVVQLPLATLAEREAAAQRPPAADGEPQRHRVMIVDDSVDGAESMSVLLEMLGHEVRVVYEGKAALPTAQEFKPEVVILDIGLPDMSGYQVARALRAHPVSAGALLIALTGYGQQSDRQRTHEAGFDHHLVKPASLEDVERAIAVGSVAGAHRNPGVEVRADPAS